MRTGDSRILYVSRANLTMQYTAHQGSYFAHRITLEGLGEDALAQSRSTARVDLNPHQIDAGAVCSVLRLSRKAPC